MNVCLYVHGCSCLHPWMFVHTFMVVRPYIHGCIVYVSCNVALRYGRHTAALQQNGSDGRKKKQETFLYFSRTYK